MMKICRTIIGFNNSARQCCGAKIWRAPAPPKKGLTTERKDLKPGKPKNPIYTWQYLTNLGGTNLPVLRTWFEGYNKLNYHFKCQCNDIGTGTMKLSSVLRIRIKIIRIRIQHHELANLMIWLKLNHTQNKSSCSNMYDFLQLSDENVL